MGWKLKKNLINSDIHIFWPLNDFLLRIGGGEVPKRCGSILRKKFIVLNSQTYNIIGVTFYFYFAKPAHSVSVNGILSLLDLIRII